MGKVALLFAGQGAQYPAMGKDFMNRMLQRERRLQSWNSSGPAPCSSALLAAKRSCPSRKTPSPACLRWIMPLPRL